MKLLFDQNLSPKLVAQLAGLYPESMHVRSVAMHEADDLLVWQFAKERGYTIVTKDVDFQQRSILHGHPPRVIYLKVGNCASSLVLDLLTRHVAAITTFDADDAAALLLITVEAVFKVVHPPDRS